MSGFGFLGLILFSMLWLFFLAGLVLNWTAFRQQAKRKEGERAWSSIGPAPGIAGSIAMFVTVPALMKLGVDVPWPWLWILLPLFLDPYCLGWIPLVVLGALAGRR